ncbi:MAG: hypothetical protein CSA22_09065 [Deltaproteobacteria bacterium]|nr:MAG: hypothetical protein CSA22_09065 [Deltaproteobacteria bacterium]
MTESKYENALLRQADIDRLLSMPAVGEMPGERAADLTGDDGLVTQEDIDRLLSGGSETPDDTPPAANRGTADDDAPISQEEIDRLLGVSAGGEDARVTDAASVEAADALISNEDIDRLLDGIRDDGVSAEDPDEQMISQSDIDALMNGADTGPEAGEAEPLVDDPDGLITQEDIDRLLNADAGADAQVSDADDAPVSHEDIEPLRNVVPDADVPPESISADGDDLVSQDDIDAILKSNPAPVEAQTVSDEPGPEAASADVEDQVILEADEDTAGDAEPQTQASRFSKKRMLAAAAVFFVVCIAAGGGGWLLKGPVSTETAAVDTRGGDTPGEKGVTVTVPAETASIELNDFFVLAPQGHDDLNFMMIDVKLAGIKARVQKIQDDQAFFRNVIYEALVSMVNDKETDLGPESLQEAIKSALDQTLDGPLEILELTRFDLG